MMKRKAKEVIEMYTYIRVQLDNTNDSYVKEILQNLYRVIQEIEIKKEDED
jgi:hypothetical protein